MKAYENLVEEALAQLFDTDPTLQKFRRGELISNEELETLTALVLAQNRDVSLEVLKDFCGEVIPLDHILRKIVGMEPDAVRACFE